MANEPPKSLGTKRVFFKKIAVYLLIGTATAIGAWLVFSGRSESHKISGPDAPEYFDNSSASDR